MAATMSRSSNPALSDKSMQRAAQGFEPGWGAPTGRGGPGAPTSPIQHETMTMRGVLSASGVLIVLLLGGAFVGWSQVEQITVQTISGETVNQTQMPPWMFMVAIGAFGVGILTAFKPKMARITGPIYAVAIGVFLGAISAVYNATYPGIVLQAVLATSGVFMAMLFLYATRIIKVTRRLAMVVTAAMFGILATYLVTFVFSLFGGGTPAIYESGLVGIGFSLLVVGVAAFVLLLDFSFIENGINQGLPKGMEWYAAFSLLVTLVWLYLEMLRLLSKLR